MARKVHKYVTMVVVPYASGSKPSPTRISVYAASGARVVSLESPVTGRTTAVVSASKLATDKESVMREVSRHQERGSYSCRHSSIDYNASGIRA